MKDNIMYTFDVILNSAHGISVIHRCARKETAEYLRDWCNAIEFNRYVKSREVLLAAGIRNQLVERMQNGLDKYSVCESEVIL